MNIDSNKYTCLALHISLVNAMDGASPIRKCEPHHETLYTKHLFPTDVNSSGAQHLLNIHLKWSDERMTYHPEYATY